ncbi:MAG TPA: hypothetical protein PKA60_01770 [Candidatus Paceibacterota bacterium]|nr:hypothetical protein [Candidatus Paceibacterota bacterium]
MKVTFEYNKEKDIWCILNRGKSSSNNNSPFATKVYEKLIQEYGDSPTEEVVARFVQKYLLEEGINLEKSVAKYQNDWDTIADKYHKIAQQVFEATLTHNITGYLTINNRCPYNIQDNYFFVTVPTLSSQRTTMHELWHFYTWQKFGAEEQNKLGKEKYNDLKESLTVLLNAECRHLLPNGVEDKGYPQHQVLRNKILELWEKNQDIKYVWDNIK